MIKAAVRRGHGIGSEHLFLRSVVRSVQRALASAGKSVGVDGRFGQQTERALRAFQSEGGCADTGVADRATWPVLERHLASSAPDVARHLPGFLGDLDWVHDEEGHRGRPYWPGGASGVTLDPGVDLGQVPFERIRDLYGGVLTSQDLDALERVRGLKGEEANSALAAEAALANIRIGEEAALAVMPQAAAAYWTQIVERFGSLSSPGTPPSVQTVLLSLAYNRGSRNEGLAPLEAPLATGEWSTVGDLIGAMQQDHALEGIRLRRRREAALVRAEVEFLARR